MARMRIIFDGFADLAQEIDKVGGTKHLHAAVDDALLATQKLVQDQVTQASAPYAKKGLKGYAHGDMVKAMVDDHTVTWIGDIAEVRVGFDLHQKGGFHSIFIMYGTPRMDADKNVYNAIKGSAVREQIAKLQEETLRKYLKLGD